MLNVLVFFLVLCLAGAQPPQCHLCTSLRVPAVPVRPYCFSAVYVFGSSQEDVGNLEDKAPGSVNYPYGVTNPSCPKGRFSNGALFVDYIAQAFGLPTTRPAEACPCGTNFAYSGATVLSQRYYKKRGVPPKSVPVTTFANETSWFHENFMNCSASKNLSKSLFIVGGGRDDYTVELRGGSSPSQVAGITVQAVVQELTKTLKVLLEHGAKNVLVGNLPPICNRLYQDSSKDARGCMEGEEMVFDAHNSKLREEVFKLKVAEDVNIVIADQQAFLYDVLRNSSQYGFADTKDPCCGDGCRAPNSTLCRNPCQYVYFDRDHYTESFNWHQAMAFIRTKKYLVSNRNETLSLFDLCK